jgi:nucleoside diphosphate kinase
MPTTEQVLDEIRKVVSFEAAYVSREKARKFYDSHELPAKLSSYVKNRSQSISRTAKTLGLAADTLKRIMSGDSITENMLFRPRNSLEQLKAANQPSSASKSRRKTFSGDWRNTNSIDIQAAISEVANRLVFLKNIVVRSNSLKAPDSPIDSIQLAQLMAMLETTLSALKAPFVERQQTTGVFGYLKKLGKRVLDKKVENALSSAIDQAVDSGSDLLDKLGDAPSISDLGGIIT